LWRGGRSATLWIGPGQDMEGWMPLETLPLTRNMTGGRSLPLSDLSLPLCKMEMKFRPELPDRNVMKAVGFLISILRKVKLKSKVNFKNIFIKPSISEKYHVNI
jgi:hypothetical protein